MLGRILTVAGLLAALSFASLTCAKEGDPCSAVYEELSAAVVFILNGVGQCVGTGFVIDSDGLILTNAHVVDMAQAGSLLKSRVRIRLRSGEEIVAGLVAKNYETSDAAALRIPKCGLPAVRIGDASTMRLYDAVCVVGYPGGEELGCDRPPWASTGEIAGTGSAATLEGRSLSGFAIAGPASPGNSGSPVANRRGEVVALLCGETKIPDLGYYFALPIEAVLAALSLPLRIADFDCLQQCEDKKGHYLKGYGCAFVPGCAFCAERCVTDDLAPEERGGVLRVEYDVSLPSNAPWSALYLQMADLGREGFHGGWTLSHDTYQTLSFHVRGNAQTAFTTRLKVELKIPGLGVYYTYLPNPDPARPELPRPPLPIPEVTASWQKISIPLTLFTRVQSWTGEWEFTLVFEYGAATARKGVIYVDEIQLEP